MQKGSTYDRFRLRAHRDPPVVLTFGQRRLFEFSTIPVRLRGLLTKCLCLLFHALLSSRFQLPSIPVYTIFGPMNQIISPTETLRIATFQSGLPTPLFQAMQGACTAGLRPHADLLYSLMTFWLYDHFLGLKKKRGKHQLQGKHGETMLESGWFSDPLEFNSASYMAKMILWNCRSPFSHWQTHGIWLNYNDLKIVATWMVGRRRSNYCTIQPDKILLMLKAGKDVGTLSGIVRPCEASWAEEGTHNCETSPLSGRHFLIDACWFNVQQIFTST